MEPRLVDLQSFAAVVVGSGFAAIAVGFAVVAAGYVVDTVVVHVVAGLYVVASYGLNAVVALVDAVDEVDSGTVELYVNVDVV